MNNSLTCLNGVKISHAVLLDKLMGASFVYFPNPYLVAYYAGGGTPRIYDSLIMDEGKSYPRKHGIFISDGAHAGLETGAYIAQALREKKIGWKIHKTIIPSLTGAAVLSLGMRGGSFDPRIGHRLVENLKDSNVKIGNVGAGTGVSVGKFSWTDDGKCLAMKTGIGTARYNFKNGVIIAVMSVVNALGNVIKDGKIFAGNRNDKVRPKFRTFDGFSEYITNSSNTTISIVGTNAKLQMEDLRRIAKIASHGQVRAIKPVNTSIDGDTVFAFTTEEKDFKMNSVGKQISSGDWFKLSVDMIGQVCANVVQESIYDACNKAETIKLDIGYKGIIPSIKDYKGNI